jgi:hypothetical protein
MSIEELAKLVESCRLRYECLGMMNVAGMDEIERALSSMQYEDARRALLDAERKLRDALAAKGEADSLILRLRDSAEKGR